MRNLVAERITCPHWRTNPGVRASGGTTPALHRVLQPERVLAEKEIFFIWIRYNALKSPDSAKEKQGNPS
jgi:hypothetical protein